MSANFRVQGINRVVARITSLTEEAKNKIEKEVNKACLDLQGKAQRKAPVDTGDLRGSASSNVEVSNNTIKGEVGFNTPYAMKQHEDLSFRHPRGGEAKYLENPLKENQNKYMQNINNAVIDALRR